MAESPRRRRVRHALVRYRRPLAAGCAFLSVVFTVSALSSPTRSPADGGALDVNVAHTGKPGIASGDPLEAGLVAAPVRLADAEVARLLAPGSIVDVLAADGEGRAHVVADAVEVLSVPPSEHHAFSSTDFGGALLLLAVTPSQATGLAAMAAVGPLSVVLRT